MKDSVKAHIKKAALFDDLKVIKKYTNQSNCDKILKFLIKGMAPACITYVCEKFRPNKENAAFIHQSLLYGNLELPEWLHQHGFKLNARAYYYACFVKKIDGSYRFAESEKYVLATVIEQCEWVRSKGIEWDTHILKVLLNLRLFRIAPWFIRSIKHSFKNICRAGSTKLFKLINARFDLSDLKKNREYVAMAAGKEGQEWLIRNGFAE